MQTKESFLNRVREKNPWQPEFHQAVEEVISTLWPFIESNPDYASQGLLERLVEPERTILFRVPWMDDNGVVHVNRGYRVEMNSAIGPYKGGLRFHPSVNLGILKFLAFEQVFKNALTTLPMGGGKGGSDFDPKGRSDNEIMRFCQSFMSELFRHIGANTDIPAGDIGVGAREIGYLFGQYKKLRNEFTGVLTGKALCYGGSLMRPEATGYGTVYFAQEMLSTRKESLEGKTVVISGSGNVAQYAAEKAMQFGGKVVSLSDSCGAVYDPGGITPEKLAYVKDLKNVRRGRIQEYVKHIKGAQYMSGKRPWSIPCQVALPCATQNELEESDAKTLLKNGCTCVAEGANMPSTIRAIKTYLGAKILYGPGKAANAGGVSTSGLEMSQNASHTKWTAEEVDKKLHAIMLSIHDTARVHGIEKGGFINYVTGANIAGFKKVADAMLSQGLV